ncbi:uncharacterized protein LOC133331638, partial [Musca vetustissima]|uniref:uncharacterized protein LOC133331638 n=1 Tax=Musca vetustissima TaxID=27455 RepID=UPI002AB7277C
MAWNVDLQLKQAVRSVEIEAKLLRKVNKKFEPFLYEDTVDLCDFLERPQKRHIFWGRVYKMALKYSNLNHTCPFEDLILVRNFLFDDDVFKVLPFPRGHYMMDLRFLLNGTPKVHAKLLRWEQHRYQPFIYDDHIDVCDFLDNAKRQVFWGLIYETIKKFSNFNHSCPLDEKLVVKNFIFDSRQFKMVPLPRGKYLLDFLLSTQ